MKMVWAPFHGGLMQKRPRNLKPVCCLAKDVKLAEDGCIAKGEMVVENRSFFLVVFLFIKKNKKDKKKKEKRKKKKEKGRRNYSWFS